MPLASSTTQDYVQSCLYRIEREFGISQAKVLATALRIKRMLDKSGAIAFGICPQYLPPDDEPWVPYHGTDSKVCFKGPEVLLEANFQAALPSLGTLQPAIQEHGLTKSDC